MLCLSGYYTLLLSAYRVTYSSTLNFNFHFIATLNTCGVCGLGPGSSGVIGGLSHIGLYEGLHLMQLILFNIT